MISRKKCGSHFRKETTIEKKIIFNIINIDIQFILDQTKLLRENLTLLWRVTWNNANSHFKVEAE